MRVPMAAAGSGSAIAEAGSADLHPRKGALIQWLRHCRRSWPPRRTDAGGPAPAPRPQRSTRSGPSSRGELYEYYKRPGLKPKYPPKLAKRFDHANDVDDVSRSETIIGS